LRLLADAIRRQPATHALLVTAARVAEAGIEPTSMAEIDREVEAVRAERGDVRARPKTASSDAQPCRHRPSVTTTITENKMDHPQLQ